MRIKWWHELQQSEKGHYRYRYQVRVLVPRSKSFRPSSHASETRVLRAHIFDVNDLFNALSPYSNDRLALILIIKLPLHH